MKGILCLTFLSAFVGLLVYIIFEGEKMGSGVTALLTALDVWLLGLFFAFFVMFMNSIALQ